MKILSANILIFNSVWFHQIDHITFRCDNPKGLSKSILMTKSMGKHNLRTQMLSGNWISGNSAFKRTKHDFK